MKTIKLILAVFLMVSVAGTVFAATPSPLFYGNTGNEVGGKYVMTIKKMELSQDGSNWVTVGEGSKAFNLAGANPGADFGSYVSGANVPNGKYTKVRLTMSRTQTLRGQGTYNGTVYYTTTSNGSVTSDGEVFYYATTNPSLASDVSFTIPKDATGSDSGETFTVVGNDIQVVKTLTPAIVIDGSNAAGTSLEIRFNTKSMLGFQEGVPGSYFVYSMPPQSITQ
jgi:hypothetical protein